MGDSWGRIALVWTMAAGALACGPGHPPEPPAPVRVSTPSRIVPPSGDGGLAAAPLEPPGLPAPPRPWFWPAVRVTPRTPREGTAVAVHVTFPPGGREPAAILADLSGRPVRLARLRDGWFGLGALPIGASGTRLLRLRHRVSRDSVLEQSLLVQVRPGAFPFTALRVEPDFAAPPPATLARIRRERERIRAVLGRFTPNWLVDAGFAWPRPPRFTSPFGQRRLFNGNLRSRHLGLDLAGHRGDPVRAAASGRVALTGNFYYQGNAVYIDHGLGVYTGYFHFSRIDVREGEWVERGQILGRVGATGRVTGPHLHWSLYVAGENLDPASLLDLDIPNGATDGGPPATTNRAGGPTRDEERNTMREEQR
ncbi:MAG: M23 family metallopeptidase [Gemmatimonadota bacterium]